MPRRHSQSSRQPSQSRSGSRQIGESASDSTVLKSQGDAPRFRETSSEIFRRHTVTNARPARTLRQNSEQQPDEQHEWQSQSSDYAHRLSRTAAITQLPAVAESVLDYFEQQIFEQQITDTHQTRGSSSNLSQQPASLKDSTTALRGRDPSGGRTPEEMPEYRASTSRVCNISD